MKKLLTVLLALLVVTGVVFADGTHPENDDYAKLTLQSSVTGYFEHGFKVYDGEGIPGDLGANLLVGVNLHGDDRTDQLLGTYHINTNSSLAFKVNFDVTPMYHLKDGVDSLLYYVPYLLDISSDGAGDGARFNVKATTAGEATKWNSYDGGDEELYSGTLIDVDHGGSESLTLTFKATFADNDDLPEGNYEGTIVATLVVTD